MHTSLHAACDGGGGAMDPPIAGRPSLAVIDVTSASDVRGPNTCDPQQTQGTHVQMNYIQVDNVWGCCDVVGRESCCLAVTDVEVHIGGLAHHWQANAFVAHFKAVRACLPVHVQALRVCMCVYVGLATTI
jgi:hypothetical protein